MTGLAAGLSGSVAKKSDGVYLELTGAGDGGGGGDGPSTTTTEATTTTTEATTTY